MRNEPEAAHIHGFQAAGLGAFSDRYRQSSGHLEAGGIADLLFPGSERRDAERSAPRCRTFGFIANALDSHTKLSRLAAGLERCDSVGDAANGLCAET
jgi:hypothetical protein